MFSKSSPPSLQDRAARFVRWALGLVLLVAAGLKVHSLALDPLSGDAFLASPRLLIATIEVEIVLGLWLLSGEAITVDPPVRDIGNGGSGEVRLFRVQLTNHTDRPIRLVGGTTSCACMATNDLPLTLPPRETGTIEVSVKFVGSPGRFRQR